MPASRALDDDSVVPLVRKTAAWAWRLLVIVLAVVVLLWVVRRLQVIVVPVALATMVAALMVPAVDWLDRRGAPRGGAVALVLLGGAAIGFAVSSGIVVASEHVHGVLWVGFVAAIMVPTIYYERKPPMVVAINAGYQLDGLVVMGAILGLWR